MSNTTIPAGYRLSITSWENDGNAYHTEILEGLSKERVDYLLELCKLFRCGDNNNYATLGNMPKYDSNTPLAVRRRKADDAIRVVMEKHKDVLTRDELEELTAEYDPFNKYSGPEFPEMMSAFLSSARLYVYRVYENAKVEYIPHAINMADVTGEFDT